MIIDEAAHISQALFYKTLVPILQMKYTSLLALSSPEGDDNYFSTLLTLKDKTDNTDFFQKVDCFQICKSCERLPDRAERIKCNHIPNAAFWLSSLAKQKLKPLYENNPEDAIREFGGMVISDYKPALNKEEVQRWFERPRWASETAPAVIFISADPSAGGPSHMSMSCGFVMGIDTVVSF